MGGSRSKSQSGQKKGKNYLKKSIRKPNKRGKKTSFISRFFRKLFKNKHQRNIFENKGYKGWWIHSEDNVYSFET